MFKEEWGAPWGWSEWTRRKHGPKGCQRRNKEPQRVKPSDTSKDLDINSEWEGSKWWIYIEASPCLTYFESTSLESVSRVDKGVPAVVQWVKNLTAVSRVPVEVQAQTLARSSGLKDLLLLQLLHRSQLWLRFHPWLGNFSTLWVCRKKKNKKKKRKQKKSRPRWA